MSKAFEKLSSLVTIAGLLAVVIFGWYQYQQVHLPEFEELKVAVTYQSCVQQCVDVCRANKVPVDKCNCSHCKVYRVVGPGAGVADASLEVARRE